MVRSLGAQATPPRRPHHFELRLRERVLQMDSGTWRKNISRRWQLTPGKFLANHQRRTSTMELSLSAYTSSMAPALYIDVGGCRSCLVAQLLRNALVS